MENRGEVMSKPKFIFLNDEIIPYEEAKIHVMTPCVRYGALIFEGIRVYWNKQMNQLYVFRLDDHSKRMIESAKLMSMQHDFTHDYISSVNIKLLKALKYTEDLHVRQMVFIDGDEGLSSSSPISITSVALPRGRSKKFNEGLSISVSSWSRIDDRVLPPRIKSAANYQNSRLGAVQAKLDGYDSTIFLNTKGKVTEGPGACLFMVKNGSVSTPTLSSGVLDSITRDTLIKLFNDLFDIKVVEREIDRTELYIADELFFCGSGAEIIPIIAVDKKVISTGKAGEMTLKIREQYFRVVRGENPDYLQWLTPIY